MITGIQLPWPPSSAPRGFTKALKLTHKELFQFILIYVVGEVSNKQLVAIWVANYSAIV